MGKKSLTKSTTKKKKTTEKKPSGQAADIAVESTKAPETMAAKPAPAVTEKKKPAAKKPTIKTLLKKDFGQWAPVALFSVSPDETSAGNYTAPPFIDETDPSKAETIRALLSKQFDLSVVEALEAPPKPSATPKKKAQAPATAPESAASVEKPVEKKVEKKPLSIPELLNLKFESWQPEKLFTPSVDPAELPVFSAPAFVDAENPEETAKIKALLTRQFDLSVVEVTEAPAATEPAEKAEAPVEPPAPVAEIAEPAIAEPEKTIEPAAAKQPEAPAPEPEKPAVVVETPKPAEEKAPEPAAPAPPKPAEVPKKEPEKPKVEIKKETPKAPAKPAPKPAAEKPPAPPAPIEPQKAVKEPETISGPIKMLIACVAGIFGLLIFASAMNTKNYYLKPADNAVEIWQGSFSPKGRNLVISIPGATITEPAQSVYTKKQALVPAFDYYIKKAEALTETKGQPDFEAIKSNLYKAIRFAPTTLHEKDAKSRLNKIECLFLIYKADVAAGKGTLEGYEAAINDLNRAKTLGVEGAQKTLVDEKLDKLTKAKAALAEKTETPSKVTVPLKKHNVEPKPH